MASILITGASRGIGMATALVLARAGHRVYAGMRAPSPSPELAQAAEKEGLAIKLQALDVDSDESVRNAIDQVYRDGPLDVLVNNAGIERRGSVEELSLADFRAVMETNYFGPLRCIQAVLPRMRERRSGHIVNITSVAGRLASSPFAPYTASKFALEALSEALAQEAKMFNIRVSIVEPGIIDTAMARSIDPSAFPASKYPQTVRITAMFRASLQNPVPPTLVAEKIRSIIESDSWKLRHPVGPDSEPFLQWRAAMSDEQWVDWGAADDDTWYSRVEREFGLNPRQQLTDRKS